MSVVYSASLKYSDGELRRNPQMDSSMRHPQAHCHQHNSGLLRYRSSPSSLLASLVDNIHGCVNEEAFGGEDNHHRYLLSSSSEMETMSAKLISSNNGWSSSESLHEFGGKPVTQEAGESVPQGPQQNAYAHESQPIYQSQKVQGLPNNSSGNAFDGSFSVVKSVASEHSTESKMGAGNFSNLIRQKSSPAGFFSNYSVENSFPALREVGSFCNVSNGQASTSASRLNGTLTFSSRPSSCPRSLMPQIAENGNEGIEASCVGSRNVGNDDGSSKCYMPNFTGDYWDNSGFNAQKTASENDDIMFSTSDTLETQDAEFGHQNLGLTHHLSLPSSSNKMPVIEKLWQIQGSVPCKIRAKRGFATHPRSIAERLRRTRISERIKKLQELFPKSDKQTSTADMLDLAAEYIKDLQKQVKILTDTRAKCTCSSNQKQHSRTCP